MTELLASIQDWMDQLEALATDVVSRIAPWAAPVPTAYLVGRSIVEHLHWPTIVGVVAAVLVECLGLATTATALELRQFNRSKKKNDPAAPFVVAASLVGIYLVAAFGLTIVLDVVPSLAQYSPAIFPVLSLTGVAVLALRSDHRRRLAAIETVKQERRERRQGKRKSPRQSAPQSTRQPSVAQPSEPSKQLSDNRKQDTNLDRLQVGRKAKRRARQEALLAYYRKYPDAGPTEAGQAIGVSRQTVYVYNEELEATGKLERNGDGWEVRG